MKYNKYKYVINIKKKQSPKISVITGTKLQVKVQGSTSFTDDIATLASVILDQLGINCLATFRGTPMENYLEFEIVLTTQNNTCPIIIVEFKKKNICITIKGQKHKTGLFYLTKFFELFNLFPDKPKRVSQANSKSICFSWE